MFCWLQQSYSHYSSLSVKLGVNLNKLRDSGHLAYVEGLKFIGETIVSQGETEEKCAGLGDGCELWANQLVQNSSLKELFLHIQTQASSLCDINSTPVVMIDDLSVLLSLGISTSEILTFLHYVKSEFVCKMFGSVVLYLHGDQSCGDEEETVVWKTMCHMCTLQLEVTGLDTGYCKEVHGEIFLTRRNGGGIQSDKKLKNLSKQIQYQVTDKSVVCFAVGTSSVVL